MPHLIVLNRQDNTAQFFDATTRKRVKSLKVGAAPFAVTVAPNGRVGYVTNSKAGTLSVLDVVRLAVTGEIRPAKPERFQPQGLAVTPDGGTLVVASGESSSVHFFDSRSGAETGRIDLGGGNPLEVVMSPKGERAYVTLPAKGEVAVVSPRDRTLLSRHAVGRTPSGADVTAEGRLLVVACTDDHALVLWDTTTGAVVGKVATARGPVRVRTASREKVAYVSCREGAALCVVDLEKMEVTRTIPVGAAPGGLAVGRGSKIIYVASAASNTVALVDMVQGKVRDRLEAGIGPDGLFFKS